MKLKLKYNGIDGFFNPLTPEQVELLTERHSASLFEGEPSGTPQKKNEKGCKSCKEKIDATDNDNGDTGEAAGI
jgi:hypothetical protein